MSGPRQEAADTYRNVDMTTLTFQFVTSFHFLISVTLSSVSLIFAMVCLRKDVNLHKLSKIYKNNIFQKLHFRVSIQGYRHKTYQPYTLRLHAWLQRYQSATPRLRPMKALWCTMTAVLPDYMLYNRAELLRVKPAILLQRKISGS